MGARSGRGRTMVAVMLAVMLFTAVMLTLIGTAIFPGSLRLAAPVLCGEGYTDSAVVQTSRGTDDGATIVESALYCIDADGWALEANLALAYLAVAGIAFAVLLVLGVLLFARRRVRLRRAAAGIAAAALLAGCSWGTQDAIAFDERTSLLGPVYLDGGAQRVADAFEQRLGGPPRVTSFTLYPGHVVMEAQDPRRPDRFDRYAYAGGRMQRPQPLDVSDERIEGTLFDLDDLALDQVPAMVRTAVRQGRVEGGDVTHLSARRRAGGPVRITAFVDGQRGDAVVEFDAAGELVAP